MKKRILLLIIILIIFSGCNSPYKYEEKEEGYINEINLESENLSIEIKINETSQCQEMNSEKTICIDNLPGNFTEQIGDYKLKQKYNKKYWKSECDKLNDIEICTNSIRLEYINEKTSKEIHIMPTYFESGKEEFLNFAHKNLIKEEIKTNVYKSIEKWEILWLTEKDFDMIWTQTYNFTKNGNSISYDGDNADLENEVIQLFLKENPPKIK